MIKMDDYSFSLRITGVPPILANDMYFSVPKKYNKTRKDGTTYTRMMATTAATPALKTYQATMSAMLDQIIDETTVQRFKEFFHRRTEKDYGIRLTITHSVPSSKFFDYDLSNTIKSFEDCLVKRLKVDDKYTTEIIMKKVLDDDAELGWVIDCKYELVEVEK